MKRLRPTLTLLAALALAPAAASPPEVSADAHRLWSWVMRAGDHGGAPFIVIDKRQARLWLFDGRGELLDQTPVLLGLARGDHSVPGIGERAMKDIRPHERTTPAGRFVVESGYNLQGEDIFWIDYDAAVSMHRVRATQAAQRRLERLASATARDNRISYGCINVPAAFFDARLQPLLWKRRGVVYLLPEQLPLDRVFAALAARGPRERGP